MILLFFFAESLFHTVGDFLPYFNDLWRDFEDDMGARQFWLYLYDLWSEFEGPESQSFSFEGRVEGLALRRR